MGESSLSSIAEVICYLRLMRQKGYNNIDLSILNLSFKIFTKVATIRLNIVADHTVRPSQTVFMQGRNILDGIVTLHETVHELHT
jgi:hypothetical protein